jgi:pilus assembly protein Flp/PilA
MVIHFPSLMRYAVRSIAKAVARWLTVKPERGVTAIEYALLASLIAVVIVTAVALAGTKMVTTFTTIAGKL